jgi:hypothetical protein
MAANKAGCDLCGEFFFIRVCLFALTNSRYAVNYWMLSGFGTDVEERNWTRGIGS